MIYGGTWIQAPHAEPLWGSIGLDDLWGNLDSSIPCRTTLGKHFWLVVFSEQTAVSTNASGTQLSNVEADLNRSGVRYVLYVLCVLCVLCVVYAVSVHLKREGGSGSGSWRCARKTRTPHLGCGEQKNESRVLPDASLCEKHSDYDTDIRSA